MFLNVVDHRVIFLAPRLVDMVVSVFPLNWPVRRNHVHIQLIDVVELSCISFGRARHAAQLLVQPEIILNRDRRQGLRFTIDLNPFFGLDRLMQTVAPAAARHLATSIFVDNNNLVLFNDVLNVFLEQAVSPEQL